jgi:oligopeptide transport system permease protein
MGTDILGRDWFSRLIHGARLSIGVAVSTQVIVVAIGVTIGLAAGYAGRWVDDVLMRLTDLMYSFPDLLFIILLRSVLGGDAISLVLAIGLVSWPDLARLMRAQTMALKQEEYVLASRSLGASGGAIVWRHILPNAIGPAIVVITFGIPRVIFAEAALSFIGFGIDPPAPSWGSMISEGYSAFLAYPHLVAFPALAISLLMLGFTLLGDGLRDALDPRTRR